VPDAARRSRPRRSVAERPTAVPPANAECGVQTFLPYPDFARSAAVLDDRRLGKQRVETLQVLRALHVADYGWQHHPVVRMWRGYTKALVAYGLAVTAQWSRRGFTDTCAYQIAEFWPDAGGQQQLAAEGCLPRWLGWEALHRSHRSALVRKDPEYYRPLFPDVPEDLPYIWPEPKTEEPAEPGRLSAWVVRAGSAEVLAAFRDRRIVGLAGFGEIRPLSNSGRRTKRQRQVLRFASAIREGDVVVVPIGATLLIGTVTGVYEHDPNPPPPGLHHTRPVRWIGEHPRSALQRPAALQDPQAVFALYDEADLLAQPPTSRSEP
jgi:hypothetical protein